MESSNVIAWLLPASTNQPAQETLRLPQNANRFVPVPSSYDPTVQTPNPNTTPDTIDPSLLTNAQLSFQQVTGPRSALELSFTKPPKNNTCFVLGTDPERCDILLPKLPNIGPVHCHLTFDADQRLVIRDTSSAGTAVWYDGASTGDHTQESWILSSGLTHGFPSTVDRITIDIQTVRFQLVVNEIHLTQPDVYAGLVDDFMSPPAGDKDAAECDFYFNFDFDLGFDLSYDYDYDFDFDMTDDEKDDVLAPLPSVVPPVFVKYLLASDDGLPPQTYLWNMARPWEPLVKAAC
ncbi:hypothetical protein CCHL11_06459 [Colletotrichum chlorophyti]|uniref:FHA domain-containing protein n=1 Tax=Colletotrichum chlorophyti TaxID=708187 RepID=A0A1Q8RSH4_9PEZI|nr:hypothetical protein CCHL11_06459 [Colletotrichum chlorophyti]